MTRPHVNVSSQVNKKDKNPVAEIWCRALKKEFELYCGTTVEHRKLLGEQILQRVSFILETLWGKVAVNRPCSSVYPQGTVYGSIRTFGKPYEFLLHPDNLGWTLFVAGVEYKRS